MTPVRAGRAKNIRSATDGNSCPQGRLREPHKKRKIRIGRLLLYLVVKSILPMFLCRSHMINRSYLI